MEQCLCVCVCVYIYIYIYIYTHTHTYVKDADWITTVDQFEQLPVFWGPGTHTAITELAAN
jgi:hypothetical protein